MTLFSSIQMGSNALRTNEIALQVVGQNIANANTPGYIREEIELAPSPTQQYGGLLLGTGVQVDSISQKLDKFLEDRLRGAVAEDARTGQISSTYSQIEGVLDALGENDIGSAMNRFFSSISEILNQPESPAVRNLTVLQGQTLTQDFQSLAAQARDLRVDANNRVENMVDNINRLLDQVQSLNVAIVGVEGGSVSKSAAVGLRDQRLQAMEELSRLIGTRSVEQEDGSVTVYSGGDYLVFEGLSRPVDVVFEADRGMNIAVIQVAETKMPLYAAGGELKGLSTARDDVLGGFLDKLDSLAETLVWEFNKVYSSGQGLTGFTSASALNTVADSDAALDQAGLIFTPKTGSFELTVENQRTGLSKTSNVLIDLKHLGNDTTLTTLQATLNGIEGIRATIDRGRLNIESTDPQSVFSLGKDTSGVLATLGINTFFTGSTAGDIGVNSVVKNDPTKFAASTDGIGPGTGNAQILADFLDRPLASRDGATLGDLYNRMTGEITQGSAEAKSVNAGAGTFESTLRAQKLSISSVNVDEEAVRMISYQRAYQAMARYISTLSDMLEMLVSL